MSDLTREEREKLMSKFMEFVTKGRDDPKPSKILSWLKDYRDDIWGEDSSQAPPCPDRETIKNWLTKDVRSISPKYAPFVRHFLEEEGYDVLPITLDELDRISEVQKFFGNETSQIKRRGPAIAGDWLMYRRWRRDALDRYIVSPVNFEYHEESNVITSTDTLRVQRKDAQFPDSEEKWKGIAIPQGRFIYTIYRSIDIRLSVINNLKFTVLDSFSHSDRIAKNGLAEIHIMSGFSMIGVNGHSTGNSFVTVLERIHEPRNFDQNPIAWADVPQHVKDELKDKEESFMNRK